MPLPPLKPASTAPQPCKICGGKSALFGVVDFNKHCAQPGQAPLLPLSGVPVYYRRCAECEFLYTDAFDDWSIEDFRTHIYNDGYAAIDPEYAEYRPRENATWIENYWGELRSTLRVLDFGGGNDVLCATLRAKGFASAITYDPIVPQFARRPEGKFDLVTCFETIEHMPDPVAGLGSIVECSAEPGLILYSTVLQPHDLLTYGLSWWYVGPRNGHVSMFSTTSLAAAWARHGYKTVSLNRCVHLAFRTLPAYLPPLRGNVADPGRNSGAMAAA